MNERIRELAEQSRFFPVPDETETDWEYRAENARYEKFAELIVKECAGLVEGYHNEITFYRADSRIKEHFGIEG